MGIDQFDPADNFPKDKTQEIREFPKQKKLIGKQRPIPGLLMWEFDIKNQEVNQAKYNEVNVDMKGNKTRTIIIREYCYYAQALNKRNALKHFARQLTHRGIWAILDNIALKENIKW